MQEEKKVALIILDGWGYGDHSKADAIYQANTPVFDQLIAQNPNAKLLTDGESVGLPEGQMGNSEVGHLNIGAGRVVYQDLVKINRSIKSGEINSNTTLLQAFDYAKSKNKAVHFLGLVSEGGIHSHQDHLVALCKMAAQNGVSNSFIHAFTDGRDTDPHSGIHFLEKLEKDIKATPTKIASICGRYYAMDRDLRWERIKLAYDALIHAKGKRSHNALEAVQTYYDEGLSDEFIKPIIMLNHMGQPMAKIESGDVIICWNYRTDRLRQLSRALSQEDFPDYVMARGDFHYLTLTNYDSTFQNVKIVFEKDNLKNTLGEVISAVGKTQLRIAETEKYPHVTFFFSGGREEFFTGEKRLMAPSPKVATYDLQPEMSAAQVSNLAIQEIQISQPDFICLNFANPDMVGHTGVFSAIVKAVETVDYELGKIIEAGKEKGYSFIVIADHGNADKAINADGSPNTAHTTNPVPVILIDKDFQKIKSGKLADVAPTILTLMQIPVPEEMNGEVLV